MCKGLGMTIGITGGIGAGKSVVTDYLRAKGYGVVDADEAAREAVAPGEPALLSLVAAFGAGILHGDGTLDRARLSSLAFADDDKARLLNDITHADIESRIAKKLRALGAASEPYHQAADAEAGSPVFLSAPLLFESGLDRMCGEVWLVAAPEDVRIARAVSRGGLTRDEARARAARQMGEGDRRARADVVIENVGGKDELYRAVDKLLAGRLG
ncbi:MAG: dephospho-CoA kinase [Clostridiales Family XIII bacterium]|jgi:dephospho-CoA kinase|nr:dephospho-CoA kinase [Clostridiales Family XIII bacterium]